MSALVIILAIIGLGFLVLVAVGALIEDSPPPTADAEDAAAPYREGLHAAVRMQRVAQDLEQQIYAAAAEQSERDSESRAR